MKGGEVGGKKQKHHVGLPLNQAAQGRNALEEVDKGGGKKRNNGKKNSEEGRGHKKKGKIRVSASPAHRREIGARGWRNTNRGRGASEETAAVRLGECPYAAEIPEIENQLRNE